VSCKRGLAGLRAWSYEWDDQRKLFSKEPLHDWASHPGDAFSYGAVIMQKTLRPEIGETSTQKFEREVSAQKGAHYAFTLEQLFTDLEGKHGSRIRIH
jgi:hypothetical protein